MRLSQRHYRIVVPELMAFPSSSHPDSEITQEVSTPLWHGSSLPSQTTIDALVESQQRTVYTKKEEAMVSVTRIPIKSLELQERTRLKLFGWKTIKLIDT